MRTNKVLYEVILSSGQLMKVSQQMTSIELSDLLKRTDVKLICVNCPSPEKNIVSKPRKKKSRPVKRSKVEQEEYLKRKEQRLIMVKERKKQKMLTGG